MKKIILIGRSECGKTTLTQALKGEKIHYHKTQYVNRFDVIIDTPGEYIQTKNWEMRLQCIRLRRTLWDFDEFERAVLIVSAMRNTAL